MKLLKKNYFAKKTLNCPKTRISNHFLNNVCRIINLYRPIFSKNGMIIDPTYKKQHLQYFPRNSTIIIQGFIWTVILGCCMILTTFISFNLLQVLVVLSTLDFRTKLIIQSTRLTCSHSSVHAWGYFYQYLFSFILVKIKKNSHNAGDIYRYTMVHHHTISKEAFQRCFDQWKSRRNKCTECEEDFSLFIFVFRNRTSILNNYTVSSCYFQY